VIVARKNTPLLSIIISTRNRQKYAISAITNIMSIPTTDIELVVHDNSDSRNLEEYLRRNINDTRLLYNYTSTPSPMTFNWNTAIGLASGKYLCLIGDDDGINPEIIEATRWADINNIDALKPTVRAIYYWPETQIKSLTTNGLLAISPFSGKVISPNPRAEMKKVVQTGGFKYLEMEIPKLYHGIVKREILDQACSKTGSFCEGLSPDISAALSVANFAKNVVSIDYPLTIAGVSKSSGSAQGARGELERNLEGAPLFKHYIGTYKWADQVPRFYSAQTIWADSTVATLKALERDDLLQDFNLPLLAAYCVAAHPKYTNIILRDMYSNFQKNNTNQFMGTLQFCYSLFIGPGLGLVKLMPKGFSILLGADKRTRFSGVNDIVEATNILTDYLRKNNKRFLDFVP